MLTTHECGIAVPVGDSARLAAQIRVLRESPVRLESMGVKAREMAVSRYTSEHAVVEWLAFLEAIAPSTILPTQRTLSHVRYM